MSFTTEQQAALQELATKSLSQIQVETALKWAYRAWAAYSYAYSYLTAGKWKLMTAATHDAVEYEHEAIEHAALCGDDSVLGQVRAIVADAKGVFLASDG